jgi:ATPase family associated with various cellular activities (AAA)
MTCVSAPPRANLSALALAAIAATIPPETSGIDNAWTLDMLADCLAEIRRTPEAEDQLIIEAATTLGLEDAEIIAAALCFAVETSREAADAIGAIQPEYAAGRPLLGLLAAATAQIGGSMAGLACGKAIAAGLLVLGDEMRPLPQRSIAMPLPMIAALSGMENDWDVVRLLSTPAIGLANSVVNEAKVRAAALFERPSTGLVVRSPSRKEAITVAALVADHYNGSLAEIDGPPPPGLSGWLALTNRIPLFVPQLGLGEAWSLPRIAGYAGPWIVASGLDGIVNCDLSKDEWTLPVPSVDERLNLWKSTGINDEDALRVAQGFRHSAGRIAEISAVVANSAKRREADRPEWKDVADGIASGGVALDKLARRSAASVSDDAMVLPPDLRDALDRLVTRAQLRCTLAQTLGPAVRARYRPGVRALLTGESGTGKSLAAHWIAGQLGLPLYRVDMAALTSKWIGETEKNLSAILSAAEQTDVLLFFDEADALFGGRTDVSNANDRYANAQTNYLLQRIEDFDGIVILASNSRDRFDPAFTRRLDAILTFPMPEPAARRELWRAHLGDAHIIDEALLDRLAVSVDLSGGHVRNIVLTAAALASAERRSIVADDIRHGIITEYGKLGRALPPVDL